MTNYQLVLKGKKSWKIMYLCYYTQQQSEIIVKEIMA